MKKISYKCLLNSQKIKKLTKYFKALSSEKQLLTLCFLSQGEGCVCQMARYLKIDQSLFSHHLAALRKMGLVKREKRGRERWYQLTDKGKRLVSLVNYWLERSE